MSLSRVGPESGGMGPHSVTPKVGIKTLMDQRPGPRSVKGGGSDHKADVLLLST